MGNIVWVASYPKSGNTWMRVFIENYFSGQGRPVDINQVHKNSIGDAKAFRYQKYLKAGQTTMDLSTEEICALKLLVHADIAASAPATVFVKTHNFQGDFKGYPLHNLSVTAGAIYLVRNPLDVTVSMARYFNSSIDEAIDYMADEMVGTPNEPENVPQIVTSWSLHVESWTQQPNRNLLVVRYEDMLDNPKKAFRKVESLLGRKNPKRLLQAIRFSSFDHLKAQEKQHGFIEKHENAGSFFRKGMKNQWQEVLTESQVQRIVDLNRAQMARFKYIPKGYESPAEK